ncbi:XTP/dITP diphosphatase [Halothermothrix orenii]|uniref:dITP/XTP pyrophosphatase n=1 Tax=Halothermothrix orenii (strain H 168 / OCM 544 / DSM 9562) TaxID=373903 RepID=B8CYB8_HALOH|nr:XTP/dITP diphosphatase [Halothermothrix orenii]ACL70287.1 non-canonical purine NTP pyrophosphatase, rdgB/HAM1 family [Halothermothrix orenii H 168]
MPLKLLVASGNQGKIREIKKYLNDLDIEIVGLDDFSLPPVEEDGETFYENALKKARTRARETGLLTLADDSGLEVDYLQGKPGVYSARYAGAGASDEDNNKKLLEELKGVPAGQRGARFKCVMVLYDPELGEDISVTGSCEGIIMEKPRGDNGFGYDPLFYVPEYGKTMAELTLETKNKISHRARALSKIKKVIKDRYTENE